MATARIISRSEQCSRELARELLARGYAVEIVSPDAIPDGLADLELRVEVAAAQLTATVEARNGGHSASLAFVHRLQAPTGDFVRRPPDTSEKVCFPAPPVRFNSESCVAGEVELPSENWRSPAPASRPDILPDPEESARLIALPKHWLAPARKLAKHLRHGVTIAFRGSNRLRINALASQTLGRAANQVWRRASSQGRARLQSCRNYGRNIAGFSRRGLLRTVDLFRPQPSQSQQTGTAGSAGSFGRAAITFAAVVVAIVLGWTLSRGSAASIKDSQTKPAKATAAPNVNFLPTPEPQPAAAAMTVPPPASKFEAKPASKMSTVPTKSQESRAPRSRGIEVDMVAHDTVTYFNPHAPVAPAKGFLAPSRQFAPGK